MTTHSPEEIVAARQSLLFMCQVLMDIVTKGEPECVVAACDRLATAFSNPAWLLPAESYAARKNGGLN